MVKLRSNDVPGGALFEGWKLFDDAEELIVQAHVDMFFFVFEENYRIYSVFIPFRGDLFSFSGTPTNDFFGAQRNCCVGSGALHR